MTTTTKDLTQAAKATPNGNAQATKATTAQEPDKNLLPAVVEKENKPKELPPILKRLEQFAELERLKERRDQVTDALQDLNDFHIGATGGASITLQDSRGTKKQISNPIVVEDMVNSAKAKLNIELEKIDNQFLV